MPRALFELIEEILREHDGGLEVDAESLPETTEELLDELQPFDVAFVLQQLDFEQQLQLLALTPPRQAAESLEHLDFELQYRLLDHVGEEHARAILAEMPAHHLVMLVNAVHPLRGASAAAARAR